MLVGASRLRVRAGGVSGTLARKPSYPTPTAPTPLRTFYVDAAGGSDSNDGSIGSPFQTIAKINSTAQAGDRFYLKGTFGGTDELSKNAAAGTSTNPVQVVVWPGETATLNNGGGGNETNPVGASNRGYWWLDGLTIDAPAGAYGGRTIVLSGTSHGWTFINLTCDGPVHVYHADDVSFYDCTFDMVTGQASNNTGDYINISNGADRCFFARCTFTGEAYHSAGLVGNVQEGATQIDDVHFFDCDFSNPKSGGLQMGGLAHNTLIEWCRFTNIGTEPDETYPPGSRDALQITGYATVFRHNIIRNCGYRGLFVASYYFGGTLMRSCDGHYHNNVVYGCGGNGLYLWAGATIDADVDLSGNVFESNIFWANQTGSATEGNGYVLGHWNPVVWNVYNTEYPWQSGTIAGNVFRNNLSARSTGDTRFLGVWKNVSFGEGGNVVYTLTDFETTFGAVGCEDNIGATDPLFVDAAGGDFHLQSGSPCINAGYPTSGVDYLGAAPDLGVFEYGGND